MSRRERSLGLLLFLVYINDMPQVVNSTTRLFADDCLLYRRISSPEDAIALQADLTNLEAWEKKWQMDFNPDKCEVLRVTLKRKPIVSNYNIHGKVLQTVPAAKYLGVTIDSKLDFNTHINNVANKANAIRAFVARTTKFCPGHVRADAYTTYVRPLLEYASPVWDPHTHHNINQLEGVQRLAARSVYKYYEHTSSVTAMLHKLGWETLQERRAYKIVHELVAVPSQPYFVPLPVGDATRGHALRFFVPHTRINAYKFSFFPATIIIWNALPATFVSAQSPNIFHGRLAKIHLIA